VSQYAKSPYQRVITGILCLSRSVENHGSSLHVEAEVHHVAILDDVFLAFQTPFTSFLGTGFTLELDEVVVGDDFGADEAFL